MNKISKELYVKVQANKELGNHIYNDVWTLMEIETEENAYETSI